MSIQNRIFKDGRHWELISGPWTPSEDWLMKQHIEGFKPAIDCTTEVHNDNIYVYRCARGYVTLHSPKPYHPDDKKKPKLSEFRQLQKERQKDLQRVLCEK